MTSGISLVSLAHAAGYLIKVSARELTPPRSESHSSGPLLTFTFAGVAG